MSQLSLEFQALYIFWVISVYFNLRNILPKSDTFLPGHSVCMFSPNRPVRLRSSHGFPFNVYRNYFPVVQRPASEVDHPPQSNAPTRLHSVYGFRFHCTRFAKKYCSNKFAPFTCLVLFPIWSGARKLDKARVLLNVVH